MSKIQAFLFSFACISLKLVTASFLSENPSKATGVRPFSFNGKILESYPFSFKAETRFSALLIILKAPATIKNLGGCLLTLTVKVGKEPKSKIAFSTVDLD